jgi:type I restriction enzyme S subunit
MSGLKQQLASRRRFSEASILRERTSGRVRVVSSGGVSSYHDTSAATGPGVILGRKGVVGSVYYIPSDYWPHDTTLWVKDFHGNDRRFVYYFFRWLAPRIATMDVGSANPTLNRNHVHPIEVRWPARVEEQRTIAHILGTLDDKIELNRRMNQTLEAMARALFKSWFVDFDPVRSKAEGRDPGLPKPLADLFPGRLIDSELGQIPEGWEVKSLDEIARFLNGLALQKYPATDEQSLPAIKIAQLRAGDTNGADRASGDIGPDYIVQDGDILFSWSGSLECVLWAGGPGALNQHLFKVTSASSPKWLCYLGIHQHLDGFRHIAAGKATTMGHIQRYHLADAKLPVPSHHLLRAMDAILNPIIESMWRRGTQSRTLATLRDALLPKLFSGELRARDAARFTGKFG